MSCGLAGFCKTNGSRAVFIGSNRCTAFVSNKIIPCIPGLHACKGSLYYFSKRLIAAADMRSNNTKLNINRLLDVAVAATEDPMLQPGGTIHRVVQDLELHGEKMAQAPR